LTCPQVVVVDQLAILHLVNVTLSDSVELLVDSGSDQLWARCTGSYALTCLIVHDTWPIRWRCIQIVDPVVLSGANVATLLTFLDTLSGGGDAPRNHK